MKKTDGLSKNVMQRPNKLKNILKIRVSLSLSCSNILRKVRFSWIKILIQLCIMENIGRYDYRYYPSLNIK